MTETITLHEYKAVLVRDIKKPDIYWVENPDLPEAYFTYTGRKIINGVITDAE